MSDSNSKNKIAKNFAAKISKLNPAQKRKFLLHILSKVKIDFSVTKKTNQKNAGLASYQNPETCELYTNKRIPQKTSLLGETYLWKPAGTEAEFLQLLESSKMPWTPRNDAKTSASEKKALLDLFRLIFRTQREGLFVSIRKNKITHWIPFFKLKFQNSKLDTLDFSEIPKNRKPKPNDDWFIESCNVVSDYFRTEYGMAEYYDYFVQACKTGIEDCDFFVNMKETPIIQQEHVATQKYGIFVLSQNTRNGFSDLIIPSPKEWGQLSNKHYPFNCTPRKDANLTNLTEFVTAWSKKKSGAVYRGTLSGCYATYKKPGFKWIRQMSKTYNKPYWLNVTSKKTTWDEPYIKEVKDQFISSAGEQMARVELVNFLKRFRGANVNAALQGNAKIKPKLRIYGKNTVKMWPRTVHPETGLNEAEYDTLTWDTHRTVLMRSGSVKEQEETMKKIATGRGGWWPAGVVNSYGEGIGGLAGGPAYKKAMETYRNLTFSKAIYNKLSKKQKSVSCSSSKTAICTLKKDIKNMEKQLQKDIQAGEKERNFIHGKGQIEYPTRKARPVGGMLKREGLKGLQKFWKQHGVGTGEERKRILELAKIKGVMSEKPMSLKEESEYKFVIVYNDIPGIRDFYKKAQMGSVLLIFEDIEKNSHWLLNSLKPMIHYIPVTMSNFEKIYKWCLYNENNDVIKNISQNIKTFIKNNYTKNKALQELIDLAEVSNIINSQR